MRLVHYITVIALVMPILACGKKKKKNNPAPQQSTTEKMPKADEKATSPEKPVPLPTANQPIENPNTNNPNAYRVGDRECLRFDDKVWYSCTSQDIDITMGWGWIEAEDMNTPLVNSDWRSCIIPPSQTEHAGIDGKYEEPGLYDSLERVVCYNYFISGPNTENPTKDDNNNAAK